MASLFVVWGPATQMAWEGYILICQVISYNILLKTLPPSFSSFGFFSLSLSPESLTSNASVCECVYIRHEEILVTPNIKQKHVFTFVASSSSCFFIDSNQSAISGKWFKLWKTTMKKKKIDGSEKLKTISQNTVPPEANRIHRMLAEYCQYILPVK